MPTGMWVARPDLRPWCAMVAERAARWQPECSLAVDRVAIVREIERAADATEPWLVHPCINTLTLDAPDHRRERDVRFVTWVAAHAASDIGCMTLDRASWCWSPRGEAVPLPAGHYDFAQFAHHAPVTESRPQFALDLYCRSTGFPLPGVWPPLPARLDHVSSLAAMVTREIAHALDAFVQRLPACAAWASAVTSVIVPLRHKGTERSSGSHPDIPGLIHLAGMHGPVAALEGLVHESAHHHFTMLELAGALVDPDHRGLYPSPLRIEPRPLGRMLLAVHALWHIMRFYDDGMASRLFGPEWTDRRSNMHRQLVAGLTTLQRAWPYFTPAGRVMVENWLNADAISRSATADPLTVPTESSASG